MVRSVILVFALAVGAIAGVPVQAHTWQSAGAFHVEYRLPDWRERLFTSRIEAEQFAQLKVDEGFQVKQDRRGGRYCVRYRCAHWRLYRTVYDAAEAHRLVQLLMQRGFEARHVPGR